MEAPSLTESCMTHGPIPIGGYLKESKENRNVHGQHYSVDIQVATILGQSWQVPGYGLRLRSLSDGRPGVRAGQAQGDCEHDQHHRCHGHLFAARWGGEST